MRLRPWGNDGPLIPTLAGFIQYLEKNARLWEKQALLKIRPIAGDLSLGEEFREGSYSTVVNLPPDQIKAEVFAMKQRTEEVLREKGREWGEVKLGVGSIRDIEFVIQYLQLANLRQYPQIRTRATLESHSPSPNSRIVTPQVMHVFCMMVIFSCVPSNITSK